MKKNADKRSTIYDIAKLANTSATTVSRVLNNTGYPVSEELRKKVEDAAKELQYFPNAIAKSLKNNIVKDIGVIIPTVVNPYYSNVLLGIEMEAKRYNYNVLLSNSLRDKKRERSAIENMYEKKVGGIIISSVAQSSDFISKYIERGVKFVFLDQKVPGIDADLIDYNIRGRACEATQFLINNGHSKIALISTPLTKWSRKEMLKGYEQALKKNSIKLKDEYILITEHEQEIENEVYEFKSGDMLAQMMLKRNLDITAVMAVNDMIAIGFIKKMQDIGYDIPEDISVIGFDNVPLASILSPPLTTVSRSFNKIGFLAMRHLINMLKTDQDEKVDLDIDIKHELIIRNTVKRI